MELLTAAQMRAIEAAAIASGAVTGLELMERAGRGVVQAILEEWPELEGGRRGALPPGADKPRPVDMVHGRSGLNDVHRTSFRAALTPPGYLEEDEGAGEPLRAVVLCGPGNNGGDGFVVARLLKARGWAVEVFLYGDPVRLPPDARVNHDLWCAVDQLHPLDALATGPAVPRGRGADLVVDALFGGGLSRPLSAAVRPVLRWLVALRPAARVVAVDVPSGLCADSGRVLAAAEANRAGGPSSGAGAVAADLTVTFHRLRPGHVLADGPRHAGRVRVADIGLPDPLLPQDAVAQVAAALAAEVGKGGAAHKYTHGHVLILSGPPGRGGAARLAARGALRIGAGLVTLGCPPEAIPENAARLDAIMLREIGTVEGLRIALEDARINALCLGPGMGTDAHATDLLATALGIPLPGVPALTRDPDPSSQPDGPPTPSSLPHAGGGGRPEPHKVPHVSSGALPLPLVGRGEGRGAPARRALVLDADALTILARRPDLFAALHAGCVLTPHAGELARLFPDIALRLAEPATRGPAYSKVDATRDAAARAGCVVLFKGPDTVIAHPDGRCAVNSAHHDRAAPWLATAGSGDVLAGFISGLLARGFPPMHAAETAAWLHVEAARAFGPGLIAEDLPDALPGVFRTLGL